MNSKTKEIISLVLGIYSFLLGFAYMMELHSEQRIGMIPPHSLEDLLSPSKITTWLIPALFTVLYANQIKRSS
jgi:hypothetical protein